MKNLTLILAGLFLAGVAGSTSAYTFSPPDQRFVLHGKVMITTGGQQGMAQCEAKLIGRTRQPGINKIYDFSFSGAKKACAALVGGYWKLSITGPTTVITSNVVWRYRNGDVCGDNPIQFTVNAAGLWSFNAPVGACSMSGTLASTPPLTIVP